MKTRNQKNGTAGMRLLAAALLLILAALCYAVGRASADDSIKVSCYLSERSLGNVIVFDIQLAAQACNDVYYGCKGKCVACYPESDYVDYVCVDLQGNTFLK